LTDCKSCRPKLTGAICIYRGKYSGETKVVLKPKTVEEVSKLMAYCVKTSIAITPQGGNTGLVGGSVPVYDEVIITLVCLVNTSRYFPADFYDVLDWPEPSPLL